MTDVEKIIGGLHCCCHTDGSNCAKCPYDIADSDCTAIMSMDTLKLLKEQAARIRELEEKLRLLSVYDGAIARLKEMEPKHILCIADAIEGMEFGKCPRCDRTILNKQSDPTLFCKYCGQAVIWKRAY